MITFKEFMTEVDKKYESTRHNSPSKLEKLLSFRYGQALMNTLFTVWPEKYNQITGTALDPFYAEKNSIKVNDFLDHLAKSWPSENTIENRLKDLESKVNILIEKISKLENKSSININQIYTKPEETTWYPKEDPSKIYVVWYDK